MIESEFRDWTRGQLRRLEDRIKALAADKAAPAKIKADARLHGSMISLGQKLVEQAKAGKVQAAGIVFVDDEGVTMTGWSVDRGCFALAGAATFMGLQILEDFRKSEKEAADDSDPTGDASADGATAQG